MAGNKNISEVAIEAAKTLTDPNVSAIQGGWAGLALSQSGTIKQTGKEMQTLIPNFLTNGQYSQKINVFTASVLTQSNKYG